MNEINFTTQSSFLHHGIQGQKWGVQNGPPYPLDSYLSTGKSLRKAARKEAKSGSKEYKQAKTDYKNAKIEKNFAKDKDSKIKYQQAKDNLKSAKANSEAAKDVLKKVNNMSLSEIEQFLKDRGYTQEAITKKAMKDYKKEHRSTITAEKLEDKNHLPEAQKNARAELRNAIATKYEDYDDVPDSLFKNLAKAEISSGIKKSNGESYKSVDEYIKDKYDGDWDYYRNESIEMLYW